MMLLTTLFIPLFSAAVLALYGSRPWASGFNTGASALGLLSALFLAGHLHDKGLFALSQELFADDLNVIFVVLTGLVGTTTALFSAHYIRFEERTGRLGGGKLRLYYSLYQLLLFAMLLALLSNNLGLMWVALEGATLSNAFLISLYRTPKSIGAAWKYFVLLGVGIAQAFFGLILLYFAAEKTLGSGGMALLWTNLNLVKSQLNPHVLLLSFIFLFVGFGTKVALVPLHGWLPDAHAEGPTPASAILSGLLLNVSLYAILRIKILVDGALGTGLTAGILVGFGMLSILVAVFSMWGRNDVKRLFSYSSIEHMGIATLGFGIGGKIGTLAALLHMTFHSLTKSSIFFLVGTISQWCRSQKIDEIRGILQHAPVLGWALVLSGCAILGVPPFGLFTSELLLFTALVSWNPWVAALFAVALAVAFGVLMRRILDMISGESAPSGIRPTYSLIPVGTHLFLVLLLGLGIPSVFWEWYQNAARYFLGPL